VNVYGIFAKLICISVIIEAINDYKKVQDEINKKVENELKLIELIG
jgi:hypothetical protein